MSARALEASISLPAVHRLEHELEATRDLLSEIDRGYMLGMLEDYGLDPEWVSDNWSRVRTDEYELGRLLEWRYLLQVLVMTMHELRAQREHNAHELEAVTEPHSEMLQGLELITERSSSEPLDPPPLEARSASISAHGPPALSAPMRTSPSPMLT